MPFISPSRAFYYAGVLVYTPYNRTRYTARQGRGACALCYTLYNGACVALYGLLLRLGYSPILPAAVALVYGRSMPFYGAFPLSFGCSLLTGARGAFNRVVFRVLAVLSRARNAIDSGRGTA